MITTYLSDELSSEYAITGAISSFAYLSSITHTNVTDFDSSVSTVLSSNFKVRLSSDFFRPKDLSTKTFYYDTKNRNLVLDVWGKSETIEISSVLSNLIVSKIIKKVEVVQDGEKKTLRIYFDDEGTSIIDMPLSDMVNVLNGDGQYVTIEDLSVKLKVDAVTSLINANSNKIYFDERILSVYGRNDLSVVKLPLSDYEMSVAFECLDELSNCLFVTDGDHINAFGMQICSLTMNNDVDPEKSYLGIAATDRYVDGKIEQIKQSAIKLSSEISGNTDDLDLDKVINGLSSLCEILINLS